MLNCEYIKYQAKKKGVESRNACSESSPKRKLQGQTRQIVQRTSLLSSIIYPTSPRLPFADEYPTLLQPIQLVLAIKLSQTSIFIDF